jgi:hypothetical protein
VVRDVLVHPHPALKQVAPETHDAEATARVARDLEDTGHRKATTANGG